MPTSLFDMDRGSNATEFEDPRAFQIAFSLLGLENQTGCPGNGNSTANDPDPLQTTPAVFAEESRSKKSQNMTECVPVPSSEHVAEIVGRQGKSFVTFPILYTSPIFSCEHPASYLILSPRDQSAERVVFTSVNSFLCVKRT